MSVLALLVLMISQLVNNTVLTTVATGKRIDADSQARLIFDRMGSDSAGIAKRPDANYYFHHQPGNDALYFFSDATGYFAGGDAAGGGDAVRNSLTLTGYRVSNQISNGTRFEMERLGRGLHWYDASPGTSANGPLTAMVYLPLTIANAFNNVIADPYNNSSNLRPGSAATDTNVPGGDKLTVADYMVKAEVIRCFRRPWSTSACVAAVAPSAKMVTPTTERNAPSAWSAGAPSFCSLRASVMTRTSRIRWSLPTKIA